MIEFIKRNFFWWRLHGLEEFMANHPENTEDGEKQ